MGGAVVCGIESLLIYLAGIVDICIGYIRISWVPKDAGYPGKNAKYIYITSSEILLQVFKHR
jgi:hypothetical protein